MDKRNLWLIILAALVLIGLFYFLKPKPATAPQPTSQESSTSAQPSSFKTFDLVVKSKKLVSGPDTLSVTEGDQVTINITNDEDEELHLHGYDKSVDLEANKSAKLEFSADKTGRFPYELEKSKTELGTLEVQPK